MTAHRASDNRAITAAEQAKLANAKAAVLAAAQRLVERPVRWNWRALESAAVGLCDEYVASLERELGRKPGAFSDRLRYQQAAAEFAVAVPPTTPPNDLLPQGKAFQPIVPRYDRGERALNRINREALAEMGKADGEELYPRGEVTRAVDGIRALAAHHNATLVMGDSGNVCAETDPADGA
jgi:hypothetical protein